MNVVEYRKWPHGVMLRLTNGTSSAINYVADGDSTPMGSPVLRELQVSNLWSRDKRFFPVQSFAAYDPRIGKTVQMFIAQDPNAPFGLGLSTHVLRTPKLEAAGSVDFFIRLEPDESPIRVGTVCVWPQSRLSQKLEPWLNRVRSWLHLSPMAPRQMEVWCPEPLSIPELPLPKLGEPLTLDRSPVGRGKGSR